MNRRKDKERDFVYGTPLRLLDLYLGSMHEVAIAIEHADSPNLFRN